jgi:hypothetical protein
MTTKRKYTILIILLFLLGVVFLKINEQIGGIFAGLAWIVLLQPFVFPTKKQKQARKERRAERKKEFQSYQEQQKRGKEEQRKRRYESLSAKYDESTVVKIIGGKKWKGMTDAMLIDSLGRPLAQKEEVSIDVTKRSFYYQSKKTAEGKTRYKLKVDLENTKVVGWKEGDFSA